MPRPRQAQGRPGTPVVPAAWAGSHSAVVDRATEDSGSLVRIGPAGSGARVWNEGRGQSETPSSPPVYVGPASIMAVSDSARALTVVEDPTQVRVYDVTLSYAASSLVAVGHVVHVDAADQDPMIAGKSLQVAAIERGSRRFSRVLLAVLVD